MRYRRWYARLSDLARTANASSRLAPPVPFEFGTFFDRVEAEALTGEIPLTGGLGSSGAAIVAALVAADPMYELGLTKEKLFEHAARIALITISSC